MHTTPSTPEQLTLDVMSLPVPTLYARKRVRDSRLSKARLQFHLQFTIVSAIVVLTGTSVLGITALIIHLLNSETSILPTMLNITAYALLIFLLWGLILLVADDIRERQHNKYKRYLMLLDQDQRDYQAG